MSDILIIILGIIFSALLGALIGQARGRPGAGAFWSLILGPIGWLVILLGPDCRPKCPECRGVIAEGAVRCKNCGVELERSVSVTGQFAHAGHPTPRLVPKIKCPIPKIHRPVSKPVLRNPGGEQWNP